MLHISHSTYNPQDYPRYLATSLVFSCFFLRTPSTPNLKISNFVLSPLPSCVTLSRCRLCASSAERTETSPPYFQTSAHLGQRPESLPLQGHRSHARIRRHCRHGGTLNLRPRSARLPTYLYRLSAGLHHSSAVAARQMQGRSK
jgi:hypothetical protein